jgi:hypothetical protein
MKPSPFLSMLREAVRHSASGDALAQRLYHEGDREHLRRWLAHAEAAGIFDKLHNDKYTHKRTVALIMTVLRVRELAVTCDGLNATFAALERSTGRLANKERRNAQRQLANDEVSPEALKDYLASIDEVEAGPISNLDPLFTVRSDKGGTRKRTIFCRILSDIFHSTSGRWHDVEVAALCATAFDCKDIVTTDAVKAARRGLKKR